MGFEILTFQIYQLEKITLNDTEKLFPIENCINTMLTVTKIKKERTNQDRTNQDRTKIGPFFDFLLH